MGVGDGKSREFSKQYLPRQIKLALERIDGRGMFQYFTICIEKCDFLRLRRTRTLQNFERITSLAWMHWRNKKRRLTSRSYPPEISLYAAMRSPRRRRLFKNYRPSRRSRFPHGSRRKPFTSLVGIKVRRAGLHNVHRMGPNQRFIKEGKRGHR